MIPLKIYKKHSEDGFIYVILNLKDPKGNLLPPTVFSKTDWYQSVFEIKKIFEKQNSPFKEDMEFMKKLIDDKYNN